MAEESNSVTASEVAAAEAALATSEDTERLSCRYYESPFPEVDELVMVNVKSIAEMGAYVSLLEYNNIEGMILLSELSRRRIRSINKLIRVGKNEVVMVLRVDKEKGYIDLSKRRVSPEEVAKCEERYAKAKVVHSVLRQAAEATGGSLEDLQTRLGWPCYRKYPLPDAEDEGGKPQFMHAYDVFKMAINDPSILDPYELSTEEREAVMKFIRRRMTPQPVKTRADIEVTCFKYDGIDAIQHALKAGEAAGTEDCPVKIKLIASPLFVLTTSTLDKNAGVTKLQEVIDVIRKKMEEKGGSVEIKMEPKVVSQHEERELHLMMERLMLENREVDGDAPEDD